MEPTGWVGSSSLKPGALKFLLGIFFLLVLYFITRFYFLNIVNLTVLNGFLLLMGLALFFIFIIEIMRRIFGLCYRVTSERIIIYQGLLKKRIDEISFILVSDVYIKQSFTQSFFNLGTIHVFSKDKSLPHIRLIGLENYYRAKEIIHDLLSYKRELEGGFVQVEFNKVIKRNKKSP